jgi:hypothetical protein
LTIRHATNLIVSMSTYYSQTPLPYTRKPRHEWDKRDFFDYEVDSYCRYATRVRYRSREWHEFTERFLPYCEHWNGCWVAEEAWHEFTLYLILPEGEYTPEEYPEGWHFRRGYE